MLQEESKGTEEPGFRHTSQMYLTKGVLCINKI